MAAKSAVERLCEVNPAAEIWWDSSPLVFDGWRTAMLREAPRPEEMARWIDRLWSAASAPQESLVRGVTTNPPLSLAAMRADPGYWGGWIRARAAELDGASVERVFWETYKEIVRRGARVLLPAFEASGGRHGFISGQTDPRDRHDAGKMLSQGLELARLAPNVMVKVPGTRAGYEVIRALTARGIATNNTLSFVVSQFVACMDAVRDGLAEARAAGVDLSRWRSVITAMSARFGTLGHLAREAEALRIRLSEEDVRWAEIAVFKRACQVVRARDDYPGKMLLCSMRMGPAGGDRPRSWHVEKVAGADVVYTCPPGYLRSLLLEGDAMEFRDAIDEPVPREVLARLEELPYFRRGIAADGYAPAEFDAHPALVATGDEFEGATRKMVEFVAAQLAPVGVA